MSALFNSEVSREDSFDLYILLGEALFQRGKAEEALKLFKEVAALETVRADASVSDKADVLGLSDVVCRVLP